MYNFITITIGISMAITITAFFLGIFLKPEKSAGHKS